MDSRESKHGTSRVIPFLISLGDLVIANALFVLWAAYWDHTSLGDAFAAHDKMLVVYNASYFLSGMHRNYTYKIRFGRIWTMMRMTLGYLIWWSAVFFLVAFLVLTHTGRDTEPIILGLIVEAVVILLWRMCVRIMLRCYREYGHNNRNIVLLGNTLSVRQLYETTDRNHFMGLKTMGYFAEEPMEDEPEGLTYLGDLQSMYPWFVEHKVEVDRIYSHVRSEMSDLILPVVKLAEENCIHMFFIPSLHRYFKRSVTFSVLDEVPLLTMRNEPLDNDVNRWAKRVFDVLFALLVIVLVFPWLLPIVWIGTMLTSPGPLFFKQLRTGLDGRDFYCYKFRSMKVNKDADTVQATKNDPRKTKWGNFLRKSNIDELPQFWNVLKGDMSVVGPRPHMLKHTEEYSALIGKYMVRHLVKPGVTGYAQVTGFRGETKLLSDMEGRVEKDIWYIENWTLLLDLRIIFLTVYNVVKGEEKAY